MFDTFPFASHVRSLAVLPCDPRKRTSFLVRLWAESDLDRAVVRGFIQNVQTGHKTFFHDLDLPVDLLRESAARLSSDDRAPLA
jgi:hypothetical protein